jgi:hypothetical protein
MSRILRRPMFRGGPASSDGVGITSGLNNPRQGYKIGADSEGVQQLNNPDFTSSLSQFTGALDLLNKDKSLYYKPEEALENQIAYEEATKRFKLRPPFADIYDVMSGKIRPEDAKIQFLKSEEGGESFKKELLNKQIATFSALPPKVRDQVVSSLPKDKQDYIKSLTPRIEMQREKDLNPEIKPEVTQKNIAPTLGEDIDTYTKLLLENAGPDKDEYTRQKYLTLAKFGLNLLKPTPVGVKPSLISSIASAGEKPLEEYGNIAMQQSKEDRAIRQLATQTAIQQHTPGNTGKAIDDLMRRGYTKEEATNLVFKGDVAAQRKEDQAEMLYHATNLQSRFPALAKQEFAGQAATAAESYLLWKKKHKAIAYGTIKPITELNRKEGDFFLDPRTGIIALQKNGKLVTPDEV